MAGFYIKKVIAKSIAKGDASITFGKGLTIIQGRSDSGKTCVANCIDFIFGGSVDKPFKDTAKYDGVTMIVVSNDSDEEVIFHRTVGKNQVEVSSGIAGIESGTYDVNYRKGAKNPPLNEVWLKLIGIQSEVMIVANARFETKRLTWRNLLRVLYLDEGRVDDIGSIVEPKHRYMENTLFLSALLYLITGRTFTEIDAQEKKEIKKARRKDYFGNDFATTMSEYANSILKECCYSGLLQAHFNLTTFDIEVNGEDKGTSHGKGYRSYLNTVMIMMLRKYLAKNAKFDPHIFIIDTPLHGFDDGVDDRMPDSMRAGLYRYFMNHQDEGQLIIIENLDHIPHLDYENHGAVVETFEKVEAPGKRYGFLNDVR